MDRSSLTMIGDMNVSQPIFDGERLLYSIASPEHNIVDIIEYPSPFTDEEIEIQMDPIFVNAIEPPLTIGEQTYYQYGVIATSQGGGWVTIKEKQESSFTISYFNANHDTEHQHTITLLIVAKRKKYGSLLRMEKFFQERPFEVSTIEDLYWIGKGANNSPQLEEIHLDISGLANDDIFELENSFTNETWSAQKSSNSLSTLFSVQAALNRLYNYNREITVTFLTGSTDVIRIVFPPDIYNFQGHSGLISNTVNADINIETPYFHNWAGWGMDAYYQQVNDIDFYDEIEEEYTNFFRYPGPIGNYDNPFNGYYESALVLKDNGAASSGTETTLTDTAKSWTSNIWSSDKEHFVIIRRGLGQGQQRRIISNTSDSITISEAWDNNRIPDNTSEYEIRENTPYKIKNLLLTDDFNEENEEDLEILINRDIEANALFGFIGPNGRVENIIIEDALIDLPYKTFVATLASENHGIIINSQIVGDSVVIGMDNVGGLVAQNNGTILYCNFNGSFVLSTGDPESPFQGWSGGLVSTNRSNGYIEFCNVNTLDSNDITEITLLSDYTIEPPAPYNGIYSPDRAGGFVFHNMGTIRLSTCKTSVYSYSEDFNIYYIGGFAGMITRPGAIIQCFARNDNIESYNGRIGGFIGHINPSSLIENCYSRTNTLSSNYSNSQFQGGFCGMNLQGHLFNCYSTVNNFLINGTISEARFIRGFTGSTVFGGSFIISGNFYRTITTIALPTDPSVVTQYNQGASTAILQTIDTFLMSPAPPEFGEGIPEEEQETGWNICLKDEWGTPSVGEPNKIGRLRWFIDEYNDYPQLSIEHPDYWS